ncbi:MAG: nucleoside 2-deoxyribosyltransferase [Candidatus Paceibacterota bacterium]
MKNIYLTSTFTNKWNVEFNKKIGEALEKSGITCYLPHRDTNQKGSDVEMFNQDIHAIKDSSMILAVALNESPNFGAEIGYAYGIGKSIIAITDKNHSIPLICSGIMTEVLRFESLDSIEEYVDILVEKIKYYLNK